MKALFFQGTENFEVPLSFSILNITPKCLPNMAYDVKINVSEQKSYTLVVGHINNSHFSIQVRILSAYCHYY